MSQGQSALRIGRWSQQGHVYHVTTATRYRHRHFDDFLSARIVVNCLRQQATLGNAHTLAFVVMPDHLHWLLQLQGNVSLSALLSYVKSQSARLINRQRPQPERFEWQAGFHDHAVRREENLLAIARYQIANPLRAGIVEKIGDYPHWDAVWLHADDVADDVGVDAWWSGV